MDTKERIVITFYVVLLFVLFTTSTFIKAFTIVYNSITGQYDDTISDQNHHYTWYGRILVGTIFAIVILSISS